jgi:hypothetical protein
MLNTPSLNDAAAADETVGVEIGLIICIAADASALIASLLEEGRTAEALEGAQALRNFMTEAATEVIADIAKAFDAPVS